MCIIDCDLPRGRRHTPLLQQSPEMEQNDDPTLVLHKRMDGCNGPPANVTIFSTLDANSRHWKADFPQKEWDKTVFTFNHDSFLFTQVSFAFKNALGRLTRDGRLIYECRVAVCSCLFRRHCDILSNTRRAYRPCLKSSDFIIWHPNDMKPKGRRDFQQPNWLSRSCH